MSIEEGRKLGNYRVLSRLGVGGMGTVYLAEHPLIGKKVALKVIHPELAGNKEVISRFFNEARTVNTIGSDHIVEIHDFGQTVEGDHFFIMEYLDGQTLADVLGTCGRLPPPRALHVGAQIASGLAAAHECNIIHRDLKPDNIMLLTHLGAADFVKVLDFGLAKILADAGGAQLTAQGVVLGTPQYMSPEACEGRRDIDFRADIYSLGILLYQMLTGRVPFLGTTMGEIMVQHVSKAPPPLRTIDPTAPAAVEAIVMRCLSKSRQDRFADMSALRGAMLDPDSYLAGQRTTRPVAATQSKTLVLGGAGAGAAAGVDTIVDPVPEAEHALMRARLGPERAPAFMDPLGSPPRAGPEERTLIDTSLARPSAPLAPAPARPLPPGQMMVQPPPEAPPAAPLRARWSTVVALCSVALVAGVGLALVFGSAGPAQVAPMAEAPPPPPPPRPEVTISLRTTPTGAEVYDAAGVRLGSTPLDLTLPRSDVGKELRFRHPDALEASKTIIPRADLMLSLELQPSPPADEAPAKATRRKPRRSKLNPHDRMIAPTFD